MNAASQLLRILAIVGALAAGALYYLASTKAGSSQQASDQTSALTAQLKDAQDKLASAQADVAKNAQALSDAQATAKLADQARSDALAALDDATKKAHDAQSAADDKDTQIADLTTKVASIDDLQKQIADLTDKNTKLQAQIDDAAKEAATPGADNGKGGTATATAAPAPVQLSPAAPAKVLQINTNSWLMVLNIGAADGVQKDSILDLKVGDEDIGKVQVRETHDSVTTVAIASLGGVSPGDYAKIVTKNLNIQYQREM
jgi:uncharacterized protein YihD (DUF1040 family)